MASPVPFSPTSEFPALLFYNMPRFGGWFNKLSHAVFNRIFWGSLKPSVEKFWKQRKRDFKVKNPLGLIHKENLPVLYSFSKYVIPKPSDWGENIHVSGYWLPDDTTWNPPGALVGFIEDGSAPVYVGFGTIRGEVAENTLRSAVQTLLELGHRVVLSSSSVNEDWFNDPRVFVLESAPHTWLFPRMSMVVHHGGAGTTAAGLLFGRPSVVVPQSNDQPMWARRVSELGVGTCVKSSSLGVSVDDFKKAFEIAFSTVVVTRAEELGQLLSARAQKMLTLLSI